MSVHILLQSSYCHRYYTNTETMYILPDYNSQTPSDATTQLPEASWLLQSLPTVSITPRRTKKNPAIKPHKDNNIQTQPTFTPKPKNKTKKQHLPYLRSTLSANPFYRLPAKSSFITPPPLSSFTHHPFLFFTSTLHPIPNSNLQQTLFMTRTHTYTHTHTYTYIHVLYHIPPHPAVKQSKAKQKGNGSCRKYQTHKYVTKTPV